MKEKRPIRIFLVISLAMLSTALPWRGVDKTAVPPDIDTSALRMADSSGGVAPARVRAAARYSYSAFPVGNSTIKVVIVSTPTAQPQSTREQIDAVMAEVAALYALWSSGKLTMTHVVEEKVVPSVACGSASTTNADLAAFDHIVEYIPLTSAVCRFAGIGTLGGSWVQVTDNGFSSRVVAHELGHNLNLDHSRSVKCTDSVTAWTLCPSEEYGDRMEVMGSGTDTIGAIGRTLLDWSDPSSIKVDAQGEFDLAESPAALVIADPAGGGEYWFEYARPTSQGSLASDQVVVRRTAVSERGRSTGSALFDRGRETTYDFVRKRWVMDTGFVTGETFVDPTGQARVEILSTGETARLRVTSPPRVPAPVWTIEYSRYGSGPGQISIYRPTTFSRAQSIEYTVWNTDGTSTTTRVKPVWHDFEIKKPNSVAAITVVMRELDGTGPTSTLVFRKNDRVLAAATATAIANGVRIAATSSTAHNRMRVTCGGTAFREFTNLTKPITVRGTGNSTSCVARLQTLTGGIVTDEQMVTVPPAKKTSAWVSIDIRQLTGTNPTNSRTQVDVNRSCKRCPATTIVVERLVNSKWVVTKKLRTSRSNWGLATKKIAPQWRVKVGSTVYTPIIPN